MNSPVGNSSTPLTDPTPFSPSLKRTPFYKRRYLFFIFAACFALIIPFVKINGNGILRMSFLHRKLEFLGMGFDTSQLYIIPFMIFIFAGFVLLITAVGGRIWCGWGCPQTMFRFVYRDLIQGYLLKLRDRKNKNKKIRLNTFGKKIRFVSGILIYSLIAFLGTANLLWYFIEPFEFFQIIFHDSGNYPFVFGFWIFMSLFFVIDITFVKENFCKYACPYAKIQSVFFDSDTALVMYDDKRGNNTDGSKGMKNFAGLRDKTGDCTGCLACVKVCPTGIDIRHGLQIGCIECLECVDACYPIMERKNKKNLINWTTKSAAVGGKARYIRPRSILYATVVICSLIILLYLSFSKTEVVLNINRTSQMYEINLSSNSVENYYVLLVANNTNKEIEIRFDVRSEILVQLKRGGEEFQLFPNEKRKKILILSSPLNNRGNVSDSQKMISVPIQIRLIKKGNPAHIVSEKSTNLFLPESFLQK